MRPDGIYVDCTMGGAGHSESIASRLDDRGLLIAVDQDEAALKAGAMRLAPYADKVRIVRGNFRRLRELLASEPVPVRDGWPQVDGIVLQPRGIVAATGRGERIQLQSGCRVGYAYGSKRSFQRQTTRQRVAGA